MNHFISNYKKINTSVLYLISAVFFIQIINASFLQILLIYMAKSGYPDSQSANFISYRFLGVLLLSVPLGLFIRGRRLKPLFYIASLTSPFFSILIVYSIHHHFDYLLYISQFMWGLSFTCLQVASLPYILRNTDPEVRMEAISLNYSTWSLGGIIGGLIIFILAKFFPEYFDDYRILLLISALGFISFLFVLYVRADSTGIAKVNNENRLNRQDYFLLIRAVFPTLLIAIGAGLTIPFVGLFFYHIHGFDSDSFALLSSVTTVVVFFSFLIVPWLKNKIGIKISILMTQGISIFFLINLALTQCYKSFSFAAIVAGLCFFFRQPLMNMAGPLTTDVSMSYVGKKNQELMSALQAAIWSGSWFISSKIFLYLRKAELDYVWIFLITSLIYIISVIAFYILILRSDRISS